MLSQITIVFIALTRNANSECENSYSSFVNTDPLDDTNFQINNLNYYCNHVSSKLIKYSDEIYIYNKKNYLKEEFLTS